MTADQSWKAQGSCRGVDTHLMFPGSGESVTQARQVCAACPVTNQCLQYALDNHEKFGIWGGKTERERRLLRRTIRAATPAPIVPLRNYPPDPTLTAVETLWNTGQAS